MARRPTKFDRPAPTSDPRAGRGVTPPGSPRPPLFLRPCPLLAAILLLATALRLHHLGYRSVWFDEAITADIAAQEGSDIPRQVRIREQIPPLYHFVMHVWTGFFGDADFALRLPSALFGIATVWVLYRLGRELFGPPEGLFAALLAAASGFQVYYAQEARPYTLLALCAGLSCLAFARMLRAAAPGHPLHDDQNTPKRLTGGWDAQVLYVLATAALLWAHLYGVFVLAAQHVAYLAYRLNIVYKVNSAPSSPLPADNPATQPPAVAPRHPLTAVRWAVLNALVLALFTPWLPTIVHWLRGVSGGFWIPPFGPAHAWTALATYAGSSAMLAVLLGLATWGGLRTPARWKTVLLAGVCLLPVLIPIAVSLIRRPIFVPRYGIAAAVGLCLLAARGWTALPGRFPKPLVLVLIAGLAVHDLATASARLDPKPDWRAGTRYILDHARRGDVVILNGSYNNLAFKHYAANYPAEFVESLHVIDMNGDPPAAAITPTTHLWMITQPSVHPSQYTPRTPEAVERQGWTLTETRAYDWVTVQRFVRSPHPGPAQTRPAPTTATVPVPPSPK